MGIVPFPHRPGDPADRDATDPATDLDSDPEEAEPSPAELAAIDAEWPLTAAEIDLVEAEIRVLTAPHGASDLDWRRLRRAQARVASMTTTLFGRCPSTATDLLKVAS